MEEHPVCLQDGHDMRPMPALKARVCKRCAFYTPIQDDDEDNRSPAIIVYMMAAFALLAVGASFALYLNI